eukprot:TRINITY_DN6990_c0_g3_i1.p1 TRINITY_DN6990_c0_g3~~TRINITY_DN6990_c0_g3_i1.p1  ORF type:complete len:705 (+),score=164.32 TRINITY_DN6990_c0_g3_i1:23-2116(+)
MLKTIERCTEEHPATHLGGVGYPSNRAVGIGTLVDYLDPIMNIEEVRKELVKGTVKTRQLPLVPYAGLTRVVFMKRGSMDWMARHPEAGDKFGSTKEGEAFILRANSGAMVMEKTGDDTFKSGGRMHCFDIWLKDPNISTHTAPLVDTYKSHEMPTKQGPGWTATVIAGVYSDKDNRPGVDLGPTRIIDFCILGRKGLVYKVPSNYNVVVYVYEGELEFQNSMQIKRQGTVVVFERKGGDVIEAWAKGGDAGSEARFLLVASEPLGEGFERSEEVPSIVGMNTQTVTDFCRSEGFVDGVDEHALALKQLEEEQAEHLDLSHFSPTSRDDDRRRSSSVNYTAQDLATPMEPRRVTTRERGVASQRSVTSPKEPINLKGRGKVATMEDMRKKRSQKEDPLEATVTYTGGVGLGSSSRAGSPYHRKRNSGGFSSNTTATTSPTSPVLSPSASPGRFRRIPSVVAPPSDALSFSARSFKLSESTSSLSSKTRTKTEPGRVSFSEIPVPQDVRSPSRRRASCDTSPERKKTEEPRRRFSYAPTASAHDDGMAPPPVRFKIKGSSYELKERLINLVKLKNEGTPNLNSAIAETQVQLDKAREREALTDKRDLAEMEIEMQRYEKEWRGYHHYWATHLNKMYSAIQERPTAELKKEYRVKSADFQKQLSEYQKRRKVYESMCGSLKDPMSSASSSSSVGPNVLF